MVGTGADTQELEVLARSHGQLRDAMERFAQNIATLALLGGAPPGGAEALVPLTPMVYVSGRVGPAPRRVLVDIGTGYFVEMGLGDADACYARRVRALHGQLEELGRVLGEKRQSASAVAQAISIQRSVSRPSAS